MFSYPNAVGWVGSVDEALQIAKLKHKPVAIYFSSKEEFSAIGESTETIKQFAAANGNSLPSTVFDLPKLINHLRSLGVVEFAKVAYNKENRALANQYGASTYTVVLVAPDGSKLYSGGVVGSSMNSFAQGAKDALAQWQARQPLAPK